MDANQWTQVNDPRRRRRRRINCCWWSGNHCKIAKPSYSSEVIQRQSTSRQTDPGLESAERASVQSNRNGIDHEKKQPQVKIACPFGNIWRKMSYSQSFIPACSEPFLGPSLAQTCPGAQFLVFMTILDTFLRSKREISRLCERVIPKDPADYYYDFVVVGGEYEKHFS